MKPGEALAAAVLVALIAALIAAVSTPEQTEAVEESSPAHPDYAYRLN